MNIGKTLSQKTAERKNTSSHKKHKKADKDTKKSSKRVDSSRPTEKTPKTKKVKAAKPAKRAADPTPTQPVATPTLVELRQQAKAQNIPGYSRMNKAELIAAIK